MNERIADCGMRIEETKADGQSLFVNPQSTFRIPQSKEVCG
jgi:hypothetical protein